MNEKNTESWDLFKWLVVAAVAAVFIAWLGVIGRSVHAVHKEFKQQNQPKVDIEPCINKAAERRDYYERKLCDPSSGEACFIADDLKEQLQHWYEAELRACLINV